MAIVSTRGRSTETFLAGGRVREFQAIERSAAKAIARLQAAVKLRDLRTPAGNRLEALQGDRVGEWSIRINDQWRICFRWQPTGQPVEGIDQLDVEGNAIDVEIVDYH